MVNEVVIGLDPHKVSNTIAVLERDALESSVLGANCSSGMREWSREQRFCDQS